ncbi:hypothetical protein VSH64_24890 [Amycolatopsis rhabdoformis]|uniref:Rho termination factor N-terminal domain-containing protein n=1 Tax=Amycolatopsis rhabdoformis TaxID=1448059 RepID=A0ABZ1HUV0_9PSEU|nr:hypothetical protein [Amycolatopsis rhabdoformis]WSE26115.1 hypothetical protein VSH64_24890 [Amycolatopsis rhabdoformis]
MAYRVTAGRVSAETQVTEAGGRATVDHYRGAVLPDDVPDEQLQHLLRLGHIEDADGEPEPELAEVLDAEPSGDVQPDDEDDQADLSAMDKDALLAYADEHGLTVDKRLGVDNLRAAIEAAE